MQLIRFPGALGHHLAGWFHSAGPTAQGALLLAHCFTCSKDLILYRQLGHELSAAGFSFFRFDFTGLGQSEGDFSQTTIDVNVEDLRLAFNQLETLAGDRPLGLIGHSLGGTASILAAENLEQARAVAVLGSSAHPESLSQLLGPRLRPHPEHPGQFKVHVAGRSFTLHNDFFPALAEKNLLARIGALQRPLLIVHGTADDIVPFAHAETFYQAAAQPKKLVVVQGADHLFQREEHRRAVGLALQGFFSEHFTATP